MVGGEGGEVVGMSGMQMVDMLARTRLLVVAVMRRLPLRAEELPGLLDQYHLRQPKAKDFARHTRCA